MSEELRETPYPGYLVSRYGEVFSHKKGGLLVKLKGGIDGAGYPCVQIAAGGRRAKTVNIHRLVAEAWIAPNSGLEVNHKNGIKTDNRVDNLELVTHSQNITHAHSTGLIPKHSKPFPLRAKLTAEDATRIRLAYAEGGKTQAGMAAEYGVSRSAICHVLAGRCWTNTTAHSTGETL